MVAIIDRGLMQWYFVGGICGMWNMFFPAPPPSPLLIVTQWSESIHKSCQTLRLVIINKFKNFIVYW